MFPSLKIVISHKKITKWGIHFEYNNDLSSLFPLKYVMHDFFPQTTNKAEEVNVDTVSPFAVWLGIHASLAFPD